MRWPLLHLAVSKETMTERLETLHVKIAPPCNNLEVYQIMGSFAVRLSCAM